MRLLCGLTEIRCAAPTVSAGVGVPEQEVALKVRRGVASHMRSVHWSDVAFAEFTHRAMISAKVLSTCGELCPDDKKVAARPLTRSARLLTVAAAFFSPVALVDGAPILKPVESMNCAIAQAEATVLTSPILTKLGKLPHGPNTYISANALFFHPAPASPP